MTHHQAFLRDILDHPDDDAPRLIYADWLDDHGGEDGQARAAYIRAQCALARLTPDEPEWDVWKERERRAEAAGWPATPDPLPSCVLQCKAVRGFIEQVRVRAAGFVEQAEAVFHLGPVRRLQFTRLGGNCDPLEFAAILEVPQLRRLTALDLTDFGTWIEHIEFLADAPHLAGLTALTLTRNPVSPDGLVAVARSRFLNRLTALDAGDCDAGDDGLAALLDAPFGPALESLSLEGGFVSDEGLLRWSRGYPQARLRSLNLGDNSFTAAGLRRLLASRALPGLTRLALAAWSNKSVHHPLGATVCQALEGLPLLERLEHLDLSSHHLGPEGVRRLARAALPRLRRLDLAGNYLGVEGVQALLAASWAGQLRRLCLAHNGLSPQGLQILTTSPALGALRHLELSGNGITDEGLQVLGSGPLLSRLATLGLRYNQFSEAGLRGLLASPNLSARTRVPVAGGNRIPVDTLEALGTERGDPFAFFGDFEE
jgi:uncharacterized protein (TIGR02996 family)